MFALVDGNNFYVSCERVFRPSLNGRPVVVLSNNDGCAIARQRYGRATVHVAGAGLDDHRREWGMRQERRTPRYTTRWAEVPVAIA